MDASLSRHKSDVSLEMERPTNMCEMCLLSNQMPYKDHKEDKSHNYCHT